jgi:hypothetical protein
MGSVGLTLPWRHRISAVAREGESRVESSDNEAGVSREAGANSEDLAIATACQAGDLGGYERLYRSHGARMKNLARHLDLPHFGEHLLRFATQPGAS